MEQLRALWRSEVYGAVGGALVGLVTGLVGMAVFGGWGATLGAVCGGATGALLCDEGLLRDVLTAATADLLSSVLVFVLFLVWYLATVAVEEGLAVISAVWFSFFYTLIGGTIAFAIAAVSLQVAIASGVIASLVRSHVVR